MPRIRRFLFYFYAECDMMIKTIHPEAFMWASELQLQNIARTCAGLDLRTQEPLSRHTSFRTGGPAALMAFPRTPEELQLLLRRKGRPDFRSSQVKAWPGRRSLPKITR